MQSVPAAEVNYLPPSFRDLSVEIVIPVYNEEVQLEASITTLCDYLARYCPYSWSVTIADNASIDGTLAVATRLSETRERVGVLHLEEKGRGRALRAAWLASTADVVAYMDVDLSTNLRAFVPMIAPLAAGHADVSIGSRLLYNAHVTRQFKREFISRSYNIMIKLLFWHHFSDAQCGFKALTSTAARQLLPDVQDQAWFFDTELLLLAEERGFRICETPVDWIEDLDSRVNIPATALEDVRGLLRVRMERYRRRSSTQPTVAGGGLR